MFMVHLTVADFFQCPDAVVDTLGVGLAKVAQQSRQHAPQFTFSHRGVTTSSIDLGSIFLDFTNPVGASHASPLHLLHHSVIALLEQLQQAFGVVPNLRYARGKYGPHLMLMQLAKLPPQVFEDALYFARTVVADLQLPDTTRAWKLLLVRFESNAAGDNWDDGRWATDLRWNLLASYPL
jgi:hypothetical protein